MSLKFAANLNFLFGENAVNLVDKIKFAHKAGFRAIEIPYPQCCEPADVIQTVQETKIEVALVNIALGKDKFRLGVASIPGAEQLFHEHLSKTINFAKAVQCKKIHIMAGLVAADEVTPLNMQTYKLNLRNAVSQLAEEGITGVIEPINKYAIPDYFMNSYEKAIEVLCDVGSENLKLMLDIYHLQHIRGNVTQTFKELHNFIGHIQIAQVPNRNEPDTEGELNYAYVFQVIKDCGYNGWIGCEYKPKTNTLDGLKWLDAFHLHLS